MTDTTTSGRRRCPACTENDHEAVDCHNNQVPMIHRTCACGCTRQDFNPAPYWTRMTEGEQ